MIKANTIITKNYSNNKNKGYNNDSPGPYQQKKIKK